MMQRDHDIVAEIMRLVMVVGFVLGVICGVFFTGLLVVIHR